MAESITLEYLQNIYESQPNSIVFAHLAARLLEKKEYERAREILKRGIESFPDYGFGHFVLGLLHFHEKNYTEAKRELEIALAYDPAIPEGWRILGDINSHLNLALMTRESHLYYYLTDAFSEEAAQRFFREEIVSQFEPASATAKEELEELEELATVSEEMSEEEIDKLFETTTSEAEESNEFEKTLDEVFKDTLLDEEFDFTSADFQSEESEEEYPEEEELGAQSDEVEGESEEFEESMDSFLKKYHEEEVREEPVPEEEERILIEEPKIESEDEMSITDEEEIFQEEEVAPESSEEEEPIDFSSVVADIISEREVAEEEETGQGMPETEEEAVIQEEESQDRLEKEEESIPEVEEEKPEIEVQETFGKRREEEEKPEEIAEEEFAEPKAEEKAPSPAAAEEKPEPEKEGPARFGRPPILSPTLGEIYIAQGRFEEAIDVFRQLLDKDPDNPRYARKIKDLEVILEKQKSEPGKK
ncbi:MAG: hypothetical protein Kow0042_16940 [Calditrichia bacterium]